MSFIPTGLSVLALIPGYVDSTAFIVAQSNASGQLDMFLQTISGAPRLLFGTSPQPLNYDISTMTGTLGSFSFSSGRVNIIDQSLVGAWGGIKQSGQMNLGWNGSEDLEAGLTSQSFLSEGKPEFRIRNQDDLGYNGEYSLYFGEDIKMRRNDGGYQTFNVPTGKMALFVGNSYTDENFDHAIIGASSRTADVIDDNNIVGTAFCSWDGLGSLYKNFAITPAYVEMGGPMSFDGTPYEDIGGKGAVVIRSSLSNPTVGAQFGLTIFSAASDTFPTLSIINTSGQVTELYPGIKNVDRIQLGANAYTPITSTRLLDDSDNGKVLYTNTGNYRLTATPSLTLPFQCSIKCEGTGQITFTGTGGTVMRNAYGRYKTAGQYTVCGIDWRSGTNCILFGDTSL
jgi:hypothetical protein